MARIFPLVFCLFLCFSCNPELQWKEDILQEVIAYDGQAQELKAEYPVDSGSSTAILIKPYREGNGLQKTVFRHIREGYIYFERHIYFKGERVLYAHYIGVAPRIAKQNGKVSGSSDFLLFSKQYFFEREGIGIRRSRQLISEQFKPKDSVLPLLKEVIPEETKIYREEYLEINNYFREVMSLEELK
ncbi:hypothetical protein L0P88_14520 [Muricauda sp. SCSIO 64092]|uniref:hypothetical protein n=1 Tax=Allomuricauda sp. SCSIO 64092 TaxID=2908842 RepID=UPI001FF4CA26|nr:hypothetical protein [Muricauda sp. SCSIO 64092]UOY05157.1 hypothetical protein L0P88_14520 [Muricauda sp. SCSIO 64092]